MPQEGAALPGDLAARGLNALGLCHRFLQERVCPGAFCIDATAGRGRDTALLCALAGPQGRVLALDIQRQAVEATRALLEERGLLSRCRVVCDSHEHLAQYAGQGEVDCIVFNFGYLPGGDRRVFTKAQASVCAVRAGLGLLKPGGVMSLCLYYGGPNGYAERDALLAFLQTVDSRAYTVLSCTFLNRGGCPPFPVFVLREAAAPPCG